MRRNPPLPISGTQMMGKDLKINGVEFRQGDPFWIIMEHIHNDPE